MNLLLSSACFFAFLLVPPVLLGLRAVRGRPAWWLLLLLVAVLGWLSWFSAYAFYHQHVDQLIAQGGELPEGWDSDGAAGVFALYMGWFVSLLYFLPWVALYAVIALFRSRGRNRQASSADDSRETE